MKLTELGYRCNKNIKSTHNLFKNKMLLVYKVWQNWLVFKKTKLNGSFFHFVIAKKICKDPWCRLVRYISL